MPLLHRFPPSNMRRLLVRQCSPSFEGRLAQPPQCGPTSWQELATYDLWCYLVIAGGTLSAHPRRRTTPRVNAPVEMASVVNDCDTLSHSSLAPRVAHCAGK